MRALKRQPFPGKTPVMQLVLIFLCLLVLPARALANVCRSIEAELATISRGPSPQERQLAGRAAQDAQRVQAHMRSIGCDRQQIFFLGQAPPPECQSYRAQLAQLQAQSQVVRGSNDGRRHQLMSMLISYNCRTSPNAPVEAGRSVPLTAGTFDDGSRRRGELSTDDLDRPRIESRIRGVGGKAVCVRLCDGYYFPLDQRGARLRDEGDNMCQALCPNAETRMYFLAGDMENAQSTSGEAYRELDTAFRYRKTFDASCFCRKPGEPSGAVRPSIINSDEGAAGRGGFDVVGGYDPAQEPVEDPYPLRGMTPVPGKKRDARLFNKPPPEQPALPPEPVITHQRFISASEGERLELRDRDGVTRTVRLVAPELSPVPEGARVLSTRDPSSSP